jgi:integrin beta 3
MFDLANAELFGELVVREVKDAIGEKLRAANAEIAELKAALADLREDMQTFQAMLNRPEAPGPPGPQGPQGLPGQDGKDGQSIIGPPGERGERGIGDKGEPGQQGQSGQDGRDGKDGHDGIGLASAFIDRGDNLVVTMTDGTVGSLGCVKGADGAPGPAGKDGKDGRDGLSVDDLVEEITDDGVLVHKWLRAGAVVKEARHQLHYMRWVGVWRAESKYAPQNVVTWDGSTWLAQHETTAKPGQGSKDWTLITKRGRDGKDGESIAGPQGPPGRDGRDLTQMGPDGKKW